MLEARGVLSVKANGYVALEDFNMSMEVTAITHRRSPVFVSIISPSLPERIQRYQEIGYGAAVLEPSSRSSLAQERPPRGYA